MSLLYFESECMGVFYDCAYPPGLDIPGKGTVGSDDEPIPSSLIDYMIGFPDDLILVALYKDSCPVIEASEKSFSREISPSFSDSIFAVMCIPVDDICVDAAV